MKKIKLTKQVIFDDVPDFWGRKSILILTPTEKPGWYWQTNNYKLLPIYHGIAESFKNRIALVCGNEKLHIPEHILSLRLLGIDGVVLSL